MSYHLKLYYGIFFIVFDHRLVPVFTSTLRGVIPGPGSISWQLSRVCCFNGCVAWLSGRTSVFDRRTFAVLRSTCS